MNELDSSHIKSELEQYENYEQTNSISDADLILINTCSVRQKPVEKLFSELGAFNKVKKQGAKIGVCGCTASHLGADIFKKAPFVSFVLGARNVSKIKNVIHQEKAVEVDIDFDETTYNFAVSNVQNVRALINISVGCDKKCAFCIVPNTRGQEISIPSNIILNQVQKQVENGAKEIMLLGQNVNAYGKSLKEKIDFTDLLHKVSLVDGVERIRFTSPHPLHMDDKFMQEFSYNPKIVKHMHMPLQSGSSKILKLMKRGYSKEWFLEKAFKLKSLNPLTTIGTDIIVGFPQESQEDFESTLDVINQLHFEQIFSFKFSPRPFTKALDLTGHISDEISSKRLEALQNLHKEILKQNHINQIGKTLSCLIESTQDNKTFARANNYYSVILDKAYPELIGKTVDLKITAALKGSLQGVF